MHRICLVFSMENCIFSTLEKVGMRDLWPKITTFSLGAMAGASEGRDHSNPETRSTREREAATP